MAHHANPSLLLILFTCMHTIHAMKKPDPPEDTPLSQHLKDFQAGKKKKSNPERPITPAPEEAPLVEHLRRFEQGKTIKKVDQKQIPPTEKTPLEAHQENFGCVVLRPKLRLLHELPPPVKTEAQKKLKRQALRAAVTCNDIHTVENLLYHGVEPMATNNNNQQPTLHLATELGHEQLVELLLDHPLMNREAINSNHIPAIVHAIEKGYHYSVGYF